MDVQFGTMA